MEQRCSQLRLGKEDRDLAAAKGVIDCIKRLPRKKRIQQQSRLNPKTSI
jgi:hypothetical protein